MNYHYNYNCSYNYKNHSNYNSYSCNRNSKTNKNPQLTDSNQPPTTTNNQRQLANSMPNGNFQLQNVASICTYPTDKQNARFHQLPKFATGKQNEGSSSKRLQIAREKGSSNYKRRHRECKTERKILALKCGARHAHAK